MVPEGHQKDWPKSKKTILMEYRTDPESCEQPFLARKRQPGESFLVYFAVLEQHCIGTRLVSRKKQCSTSHHRRQLLVSFLEEFLKPYLQNCS